MSLRDAGVNLIDCVHKTPVARTTGYPYVTIPQMKGGRIDLDDARRISREDFLEWTKKARPRLNDVVLSRRTNPGVTATFGSNVEFALGQNLVLLRADGSEVEPAFLRWLVIGPGWWAEIEKYNNVGAVFDSLKCADVPRFQLVIPPKQIQLRIDEVLRSLDDKIELNRRMNETLEAMAQAIFRDWFVDFGPVCRKMAGITDSIEIMGGLTQNPDQAESLAALFPADLAPTGLPRGWNRSAFLSLAKLISGGTPKTDRSDYWNGDIAWASAKDVSQCADAFLLATERSITPLGLNGSATKIVPRFSTVVVARGATTGRFCMLGRDIAMNQTCYALESRSGTPFWLNCAFKNLVQELVHSAHGSVFDTITTSTFDRATTVEPASSLITAFEQIAGPMFHRVLTALEETRTLAETRDYLLPRLMSGEVRVGDVAAEVAA